MRDRYTIKNLRGQDIGFQNPEHGYGCYSSADIQIGTYNKYLGVIVLDPGQKVADVADSQNKIEGYTVISHRQYSLMRTIAEYAMYVSPNYHQLNEIAEMRKQDPFSKAPGADIFNSLDEKSFDASRISEDYSRIKPEEMKVLNAMKVSSLDYNHLRRNTIGSVTTETLLGAMFNSNGKTVRHNSVLEGSVETPPARDQYLVSKKDDFDAFIASFGNRATGNNAPSVDDGNLDR